MIDALKSVAKTVVFASVTLLGAATLTVAKAVENKPSANIAIVTSAAVEQAIKPALDAEPKAAQASAIQPEGQSLSGAIIKLKQAENDRRASGFRHKEKKGEKPSADELLAKLTANKADDKMAKELNVAQSQPVLEESKELRRQSSALDAIKAENRRLEREILSLMGEPVEDDHWTHLGTPDITPTFPGFARLFGKAGIMHSEMGFSYSSWFFNDQNKIVDLAQKIVGYKPVLLQDISLIARLIRRSSVKRDGAWYASNDSTILPESRKNPLLLNDVTFSNVSNDPEFIALGGEGQAAVQAALNSMNATQLQNTYLNRLADKVFEFKADAENLTCHFNFTQVFNKVYSLGLEVPLVFQTNKLELTNDLTLTELVELQNIATNTTNESAKFFTRYPNGMNDFWKDILAQKGFLPEARSKHFGVGDISLFVNRKINAPELVTAGLVGLGITAPSGVKTDSRYLWPVQLGNGGFWEVRAHTSLFWRNSAFLNPHIFAQVRFRIPSTVQRRMSRIITVLQTRSRDEAGQMASDLPLGRSLVYNSAGAGIKETESTIPAMAQLPLRSIDMNRGALIQLRVGNLFNHVIFDNAYLDISYQLEAQQEDSLGFRTNNPELDLDHAFANTSRYSHTIAATYCYKLNENWQFEAGIKHVGWGKNTERVLQFNGGVLYNF